jgi:hypothetical protein
MTTDNFCFYLQNRLIQTSQTGGQWYSDTSPFSLPWMVGYRCKFIFGVGMLHGCKGVYHGKDCGIQMLAGLAHCSQTVGPLLREPGKI